MNPGPSAVSTGADRSPEWPAPAYGGEALSKAPAAAAYPPGRRSCRLLARAGLRPLVGPGCRGYFKEQLSEELGPHETAADALIPRWFRLQHGW